MSGASPAIAPNASVAMDEDVVTANLANRFLVTLGRQARPFAPGDPAPPGLHWCLAPEVLETADLDRDGIARTGIIPTLELPRRMWAGVEIEIRAPLRIGDTVTRRSRVVEVRRKAGRTGPLAFAEIGHEFSVAGEVRISERQQIVFRGAPGSGASTAPVPPPVERSDAAARMLRRLTTDPLQLFRFSALTFNAHLIHHDRAYTQTVEGYGDLLVHGTLTAALMLDAAATAGGGREIRSAVLRALAPALCGRPLTICGDVGPQAVELDAKAGDETVMAGDVRFCP